MSERNCEEEFYEWLESAFELSRETVEQNETKSNSAKMVIESAKRGRIAYGEDKIIYSLRYPVGDVEDVVFNTRIKISKSLNSHKNENQNDRVFRVIEAHTNLPIPILHEIDTFDFVRLGAIFSFLG